jgi:hypothetical protein
MNKIIKTFNGEVVEIKDNQVSVYVTTYDLDRDNEIILPTAWIKRIGNYQAHPILLSSHEYNSLRNQIGKAVNLTIDEKGMKPTFEYFTGAGNPEADWGYFLVSQKQAAYSVGFIGNVYTEDKTEIAKLLAPYNLVQVAIDTVKRVYTDVELLEISQVVVPANASAIQGDSYYSFIKSFITKPEPDITENYIRIRVEDPDKFTDDGWATITISAEKGIKAVIGKYKSDPNGSTHVQSYLFDKDKWTVAEAEAWVKDHKSLSSEDIIKEYEKLELEQRLINSSLEEKAELIEMLKAIVDKNKF